MNPYDNFHKSTRVQKKIISENNFTYFNGIKILKRLLNKNDKLKILDFGCGVGTISLYLANLGHEVTSIDISNKAIDQAKKSAEFLGLSNKINFLTLKDSIPFLNGKIFDLILLIEVIEHLPNDKETLKSLTLHLKKGGYMVISTPSVNAPLFKLGLLNSFDKSVGHLRRYDETQLISLMAELNLKILTLEKKESILRNSLFTLPVFSWMVRFIKGPLSNLFMSFDTILVRILGESNFYIVATKY